MVQAPAMLGPRAHPILSILSISSTASTRRSRGRAAPASRPSRQNRHTRRSRSFAGTCFASSLAHQTQVAPPAPRTFRLIAPVVCGILGCTRPEWRKSPPRGSASPSCAERAWGRGSAAQRHRKEILRHENVFVVILQKINIRPKSFRQFDGLSFVGRKVLDKPWISAAQPR